MWSLRCRRCDERYKFTPMTRGCPACRTLGVPGVLELSFCPAEIPAPQSKGHPRSRPRFLDILPHRGTHEWTTLGEGETPLIRSKVIGPKLGLEQLYFKNEGANPTHSFKDRYAAVSVNMAQAFGFKRVVVSSTGNLGVSVAAYCAAAGLQCLVLVLADTSSNIVEQIRLHGADIATVEPNARQQVFERVAERDDWFPVGLFLARDVQNPFGIEGYRPIAYEILEALGEPPAAVVFPCARGNGLYGTWKGFLDAQIWGWSSRTPAMVASQPQGANSLQVSLEQDARTPVELARIESVAFSAAETVADQSALDALRHSGGRAYSAGDEEIRLATRELALEGLFVEPSSALPVACLGALISEDIVDSEKAIICVLTGSGAKWVAHAEASESVSHLCNDSTAVTEFLGKL